ncbi:hypothetical protein PC129_g10161 [Phytophthora cactorum]|uniref:Uncharacterized protein n=1 Tax=Phytophthora cactorum TaxID=29920 RepID=A0A329S2Y5_9STRA|nr:hypothetical protein Pcac1_g22830 [Phytophthora cactorum]KAG2820344.1 hypothetical protein PC112_g11816 [Phytophthora cactorum]KAG2821702.1 hypothetical protein PC111_g10924 [Phytophthora cactorum]KAG2856743.1 hypothetical protein PC113_g11302 [Phytophthora cactorum]KAG2911288.1 hypothetical protein PC114_g9446 [Phytophthora cactorum]
MDPIKALDMENRSGISQQEVDDFANRMDLISKAMKDIKDGTFDPLKCNIPGYKTPEQEGLERKERIKREEERRKREEKRKEKEKQEEHDNWWHRAELRYSMRDGEENEEKESKASKSEQWANRILAAYKTRDANDYSLWNQWVPEDPVSLQEKAEREAELDKLRNREFENTNPEFCNQFKKDMEERQRSQEEKARTAERLKQKGNRFYKKKQYEEAIQSYMEALTASPFNVAVLANTAQCYLRLDQLDDCVEFCTRTLFVDENYVKALSRRATVWHRQEKLKEAADDMRKAFALDEENVDIAEQYSSIVGDYEDSITNSELETALNKRDTTSLRTVSLGPSSIEELRFSLELFKKMDEQSTADNSSAGDVQDAWVAYDLVLPFVEKNEYVRAKFRTSGEMDKLCERILTALSTPEEGAEVHKSRHQTHEIILSAMINCAAAAVADTPRNQVVMFRNVAFRKQILAFYGDLSRTSASMSWIVQASVTRFLEQLVDSKSWRNAILASDEVISSLFAALCLPTNANNVPSDERNSKLAIALAASSICFTLSSDNSGVQAFSIRGEVCLAAVAQALETNRSAKSVDLLRNVLGLMTNLSTDKALRTTVEGVDCGETRRKLVRVLLGIAQDGHLSEPKNYARSERALGALLNLSISENSQVRTRDLLEFGAVDTVERILSQASPSSFCASILVLSRTASLLCRLHSAKGEVLDRLTSPGLLSKLSAVCEHANASFSDKIATISTELWQLCAQIWCHFGWCAHVASVRAFLRERNAVSLLIQVIELANSQNGYYRSTDESTACERLVGNIVKVLIAMQADNDSADSKTFRKKGSLAILVKTLQELSDGLARKNVAILLAKLCQADSQVKNAVRDLRGIEMMLSVSQSLKQRPAVLSR